MNLFSPHDGSMSYFDYEANGELSEAKFAGGQAAKYEYQPSGLRSRLTYQDKRRVEYSYDAVGNLLSTKIFDSKGQPSGRSVLMLRSRRSGDQPKKTSPRIFLWSVLGDRATITCTSCGQLAASLSGCALWHGN
jgi:hypothetical protein